MPFLKFPKIFMPQKCWLKEKLTIWFLYRFSVNRSKRDLPRLLACDVGHHQRSRRMRRRAWSNEAMPAILPRWCWYLEEKLTKNNQKNAGDDCWVVGFFGWFVWLVCWLVGWVVGWVGGCCWLKGTATITSCFWWQKSCTTLDVQNPAKTGIFYIHFAYDYMYMSMSSGAAVSSSTYTHKKRNGSLSRATTTSLLKQVGEVNHVKLHICALAVSFWV